MGALRATAPPLLPPLLPYAPPSPPAPPPLLLFPRRLGLLLRRQPRRPVLSQHRRSVAEEVGSLRPFSTYPAPAPSTSIDRIVHRLRNLATDDDVPSASASTANAPPDGNELLGDLLDRIWARPDRQFAASAFDETVLPWERDEEEDGAKSSRSRLGMTRRDRITAPKAEVTQAVTKKIHRRGGNLSWSGSSSRGPRARHKIPP
ncbi:hypothetical protein ACP70R_039499 [Stipagrostis hirtigluma subsp. patula]